MALAAQKANWILGASKAAQPAGRGRGLALLLCAVRPHLERRVQMGSDQHRRDMELLECIQRRATEMIWGVDMGKGRLPAWGREGSRES